MAPSSLTSATGGRGRSSLYAASTAAIASSYKGRASSRARSTLIRSSIQRFCAFARSRPQRPLVNQRAMSSWFVSRKESESAA